MKVFFSLALVILAATASCFAEITSSPGLQSLRIGEACAFRWTFNGSLSGFQISNQTTGSPNPLRDNTSFTYNANNGMIIFIIWNVQLWDAGNYWLITNGQSSNVDYSAWLFVYGTPLVSVYLSRGTVPATEGDPVEMSCNITSNFSPAVNRTKMFASWYIFNIGQVESNGVDSDPVVLHNGSLVPGHSIKNDGRTLAIDSVKYPDDSDFRCSAQNDEFRSIVQSEYYTLSMRYRPYIYNTLPSSRLTVTVGTEVLLSFLSRAVPPTTSMTNWSFKDTAGIPLGLPPDSQPYISFTNCSLRFNFTSAAYYGKYSITLVNYVGSTTVDFHVVQPGPPDTPSNLQLFFVSHYAISVFWNVMFSNAINNQQTVFIRVLSQDTGFEIDTQNQSFSSNVYNVTFLTVFQENIEPKSNYEVRVWSTNVYGQSGVAKLSVKTRSQPKLNLSPETISIKGSQATINLVGILEGDDVENIIYVVAACYSDLSGEYAFSNIGGVTNTIVVDIPSGTDYTIELYLFCGDFPKYWYYMTTVRGIRPSVYGSHQNEARNNKSLLTAVIVLAVLLGVALLTLLGIFTASLCMKFRA